MNKMDIITPIYRYRTIVSRTISLQQLNPAAHLQSNFLFLNIFIGVMKGIQPNHAEATGAIEADGRVVAGLGLKHLSTVAIGFGNLHGFLHQPVTNPHASITFLDQQLIDT